MNRVKGRLESSHGILLCFSFFLFCLFILYLSINKDFDLLPSNTHGCILFDQYRTFSRNTFIIKNQNPIWPQYLSLWCHMIKHLWPNQFFEQYLFFSFVIFCIINYFLVFFSDWCWVFFKFALIYWTMICESILVDIMGLSKSVKRENQFSDACLQQILGFADFFFDFLFHCFIYCWLPTIPWLMLPGIRQSHDTATK